MGRVGKHSLRIRILAVSRAASQILRRNGGTNEIEGESQFVSQTVPKLPVRTYL